MMYLNGSRVEVVGKEGSYPLSWRCGEIISGDGHTYCIRYDCCSPEMGVMVERILRKAIRPCPPSIKAPTSWALGDELEVFEEDSWKLAHVSRVVDWNYFYVRLVGSSREFMVHASNVRVRQIWQGDKWVVIQKEPVNCNDGIIKNHSKVRKFVLRVPRSCVDVKRAGENSSFPNVADADLEEHWPISSEGMKKRPRQNLTLNPHDAASRKLKAAGKEGAHQQWTVDHSSHPMNKGQIWRCEKVATGSR